MSTADKLTVKILLLVARIVADDAWKTDIKTLANHIEQIRKPAPEETA